MVGGEVDSSLNGGAIWNEKWPRLYAVRAVERERRRQPCTSGVPNQVTPPARSARAECAARSVVAPALLPVNERSCRVEPARGPRPPAEAKQQGEAEFSARPPTHLMLPRILRLCQNSTAPEMAVEQEWQRVLPRAAAL